MEFNSLSVGQADDPEEVEDDEGAFGGECDEGGEEG